MGKALGRAVVAAWVLLPLCASYAAPFGVPLFLNGSGMACCRTGKASCCRRAHGPVWAGNNSGCSGACAASLGTSPVGDALVTPAATRAGAPPVRRLAMARRQAPRKSSPYPAFLYQLPPPVC